MAKEVVPYFAEWEDQGYVPHELYKKLATLGAMGFGIPESYGGAGETSFKYLVTIIEEAAYAAVSLGNFIISTSIIAPYLVSLANDEQARRWLPGMAAGDTVLAIAITEPGTGSDVAGIRTSARRAGDAFVLNGAKTFITGSSQADLIIVVARTSPPTEDNRRSGLSLLVVDTSSAGFEVGRRLDKIGLHSSDTCELAFTDVRVPVGNLLGEEGRAFTYLSQNLPRERLGIAVRETAYARAAIAQALEYTQSRTIFGSPVSSFQNTKFVLAECTTEVEAAQALVDKAIEMDDADTLSAVDAAKCKLFCTEMAGRVIDRCLQLHGGYGYMREYPIARMYTDTRVSRIAGGSSEVLKTIVAKSLGL